MADASTPDLSPAALEALADAISRPQPLCPYDPRSPDSRDPERSPDDEPCPRCGSTEDGPDMCFGADPTNFVRAAATLRALSAEVIRLRQENDRLSQRVTTLWEANNAARAALEGDYD